MSYTKYIISSAAALALLTGCGGDSSDKGEAGLSGTPVPIETQDDAQNVQAMSIILTEVAFDFADEGELELMARAPQRLALRKSQAPQAPAEPDEAYEEDYDCEVSGSYTEKYTPTETGFTRIYTDRKCDEGDYYYNGVWKETYNETEDGYSRAFDTDYLYIEIGDEYNITTTDNFRSSYVLTDEGDRVSIEIDGSSKYEQGEHIIEMGFDNFEASSELAGPLGAIEVNGALKFLSTEVDENCNLTGVYNFKTLETLVILDGGPIDSGSIKINDATFVFDGSDMNVTIPGEEPITGLSQIPYPMCGDEL